MCIISGWSLHTTPACSLAEQSCSRHGLNLHSSRLDSSPVKAKNKKTLLLKNYRFYTYSVSEYADYRSVGCSSFFMFVQFSG
jgi:hypothetical protein